MKAWGAGLMIALGLVTACTSMSGDPADPQSSAVEVAMSIGQLQALADICAAPAWSYESQLGNASSAIRGIYADAGLQPGEADGDIEAGRKAEISRRDDPSWPLDCNRFRHQVSYVMARVAEASGQAPPPLAPVDQSDWRNRPSAGAATGNETARAPAPSDASFEFMPQPRQAAAPPPAPGDSPAPDDSYTRDIP
jgi:hypothetical protein